jgi:hypothetical protein
VSLRAVPPRPRQVAAACWRGAGDFLAELEAAYTVYLDQVTISSVKRINQYVAPLSGPSCSVQLSPRAHGFIDHMHTYLSLFYSRDVVFTRSMDTSFTRKPLLRRTPASRLNMHLPRLTRFFERGLLISLCLLSHKIESGLCFLETLFQERCGNTTRDCNYFPTAFSYRLIYKLGVTSLPQRKLSIIKLCIV